MESRGLSDIKFKQQDIAENSIIFASVNVALNNQPILHDIKGCALAGEVLAIMGPSGSGKTTLLNSIAGRIELLSGEITINGSPVDKSTKRVISYVLQQDVLFADLTMEETIYFTAMLKLPSSMSHQDKMARIDYIVDTLNIRHCLNTKLGSVLHGGLSGGEKKRANIACELITNPDILLLDEPTSGLDSYTAFQLMMQLKEYATGSRKIVITTIHQPSSQIFYSFDKLLLLANGKSVYFGQAEDVLDFFANCGLSCAPHYNPADFILEKVNGGEEDLKKILEAVSRKTSTESTTWKNKKGAVVNLGFAHENMLQQSEQHHDNLDPDITVTSCRQDLLKGQNRGNVKWATSFASQYRYLTWRQFRLSKSRILSNLGFFECLFLAVLFGVLWYQIERTDATVRDINGLLFVSNAHWAIRSMFVAVAAFPSEMVVINKERASGMYRLSAYILCKFTSELPLTVVLPCVCQPITYWMAGLNPDLGRFFAFIGVSIADIFLGQSAGFLIGATFRRIDVALTVCTLYLLTCLVLGGFYATHLPRWVQYFSILYYPYRALIYLEFSKSQPIKCVMGQRSIFAECVQQWNITSVNETLYVPAQAVLELEGINAPLYCYLLSILLFIIVYRLLVYVAFVILRKPI